MSPPPPVRFNEPEPPAHAQTGGGGRIRTYEGVSRQIYSLLPLTAWVPLRENEPRIVFSARPAVNVLGAGFATGLMPERGRDAVIEAFGAEAIVLGPAPTPGIRRSACAKGVLSRLCAKAAAISSGRSDPRPSPWPRGPRSFLLFLGTSLDPLELLQGLDARDLILRRRPAARVIQLAE